MTTSSKYNQVQKLLYAGIITVGVVIRALRFVDLETGGSCSGLTGAVSGGYDVAALRPLFSACRRLSHSW